MASGLRGSLVPYLFDRQIRPRHVLRQPCSGEWSREGEDSISGVLVVNSISSPAPPLALTYSMRAGNGRSLAVADEEGYVNIFRTSRPLPRTIFGDASSALSARWLAHSNAIFDVCWIKEDFNMLTASGDQTIKLWDVERRFNLGTMKGHLGSVKALSVNPCQSYLFVSGSRDGNVQFWDIRSPTSAQDSVGEISYQPIAKIVGAHIGSAAKPCRIKGFSRSVTSVLYLNDDRLIATSGANDGMIKYWDTRNLRQPVAWTPPEVPETSVQGKSGNRLHGIAGLSQNATGTRIIASCVDSKIYMFDVLRPDKPALKVFSGHKVNSFYIKTVFSPDGSHILSGSSDSNAYLWQVDGDGDKPTILVDHAQEVTAVAWCPSDFSELATCSDDFTVRVWRMKKPGFLSSPSNRKLRNSSAHSVREGSKSGMECESPSVSGEEQNEPKATEDMRTKYLVDMTEQARILQGMHINISDMETTPPSKSRIGKRGRDTMELDEIVKIESESPLSVLSPPKSIPKRRRTIPDYFKPS